jgi:undecaprenyl-diphosphatase
MKWRTIVATATALCWLCYGYIDIPVAEYIHTNTTPTLQGVGAFLDELGKSHWLLLSNAVIMLAAWFTQHRRHVLRSHGALFLSVAISGLLANVIKVSVNRARPPLLFEHGQYGFAPLTFQTDFLHTSFPSGHATTGLALAVAGSMVAPRFRWLFWSVGIAIALGRVLYNVHYVSDVLAGAALGAATAVVVTRKLQRRYGM